MCLRPKDLNWQIVLTKSKQTGCYLNFLDIMKKLKLHIDKLKLILIMISSD